MKLLSFFLAYKDIIFLLFVGLTLRLWHLEDLMTIGGDIGYDLLKIKEITEGNLTLLGPQIGRFGDSVLYLGPVYYYLQLPFLFLANFDPVGLSIIIVVARLATTFFIYLITKKIFNSQAAICAAILSTLSPYFVNSLGPPSAVYLIMPLVSAVIFLVLQLKRLPQHLVLIGFLSGLATNFHYLGLSIFLTLFVYIRKINSIFFLILGLLLSFVPLSIFEIRNNFFLTREAFGQFFSGAVNTQSQSIIDQLAISLKLIAEGVIGVSFYPIIVAIILSAILLSWFKGQHKLEIVFLSSVIIINLVTVILYGQKVQSHYLAASYIPYFIFVGVFLTQVKKITPIFPLILLILFSILLLNRNDLTRSSGYTMPEDLTLHQVRYISKIIAEDVGNRSFNITSTLDGDSRALPYRYLVDVYGKKPSGIENYDKGDVLYVITRDPASAVRESALFEIASFQPSNIESVTNIRGDIKLIKLTKGQTPSQKVEKFVTIVNLVRSRDLWNDRKLENLKNQLDAIVDRQLPSTWLVTYDTLSDNEITDVFKNEKVELGAFLEISEKLATDASVSYKVGEGDYYRPDKVFLQGYTPEDREKLVKTYIKKFQEVYGDKPTVAGAWYIDAPTQNLLATFGVKGILVVADQYDTDAAASWGKYWSMPFYPSKFNTLEPAASQNFKIPIVNIQWAQRHPTLGYGKSIKDSRHSFQANDYINNGFNSSYFDNLLAIHLSQQQTDFVQITIGLEAGQEARTFFEEFDLQMKKLKSLSDQGIINVIPMGKFASWYQNKYPGISPSHIITHQGNIWYMSPKFRALLTQDNQDLIIRDLRYYNQDPQRDTLYADPNQFLARYVPAAINSLDSGNSLKVEKMPNPLVVENFDRLTLKADNELVRIDTKGVYVRGHYVLQNISPRFSAQDFKFMFVKTIANLKRPLSKILGLFRFSQIDGKSTIGIAIARDKLLGIKGWQPGLYNFPFQSLVKFKSPASILDNYKPWLN